MIRLEIRGLGCCRERPPFCSLHRLRLAMLCGPLAVDNVAATAVATPYSDSVCNESFGVVIGERNH